MATTCAGGVQSYGPNQVQGGCTCGWRGKPRDHVALANNDVREHFLAGPHLKDMTSTSPATLAPSTDAREQNV